MMNIPNIPEYAVWASREWRKDPQRTGAVIDSAILAQELNYACSALRATLTRDNMTHEAKQQSLKEYLGTVLQRWAQLTGQLGLGVYGVWASLEAHDLITNPEISTMALAENAKTLCALIDKQPERNAGPTQEISHNLAELASHWRDLCRALKLSDRTVRAASRYRVQGLV